MTLGAISMGIARERSSKARIELLSWRLTTICIAAPLLFWSTIACAKGAPVSFRTGVAHGGYAKKSAGILSMKPKAGLLYVW